MAKYIDALKEEIGRTERYLKHLKDQEKFIFGDDEPQGIWHPKEVAPAPVVIASPTHGYTPDDSVVMIPKTGESITNRILAVLASNNGSRRSGAIITDLNPINPQTVHSTLQALKRKGKIYWRGKAWHLKK